ncbi:MAG: M56 family metallopeptidase [Phycisphaerales bacterium]
MSAAAFFNQLWMSAIAIVPLTCIVLLLCTALPLRPSTRHSLWVLAIVLTAAPFASVLFMPQAPSLAPGEPIITLPETAAVPLATPSPLQLPAATDPAISTAHAKNIDASIRRTEQMLANLIPHRNMHVQETDSEQPVHAPAEARNFTHADEIPLAVSDENATEPVAASAAPTIASRFAPFMTLWADTRAIPAPSPLFWIIGMGAAALLFLLRTLHVQAILRRSQPADGPIRSQVQQCAERLQLRRVPEVRMTRANISPLLWCGPRPTLVLPGALWQSLDAASCDAVLLHEMAHLKRRDHLTCWIEALASILYWWHPLVWFIRSRIRNEADLSCDAWVTALLPDARRAYATALLTSRTFSSASPSRFSPSGPVVSLGADAARTRRLARRLTMIMTHSHNPRTSIAGSALLVAFALAGIAMAPLAACPPESEEVEQVTETVELVASQAPRERSPLSVSAAAPSSTSPSTFEAHMQSREQENVTAVTENPFARVTTTKSPRASSGLTVVTTAAPELHAAVAIAGVPSATTTSPRVASAFAVTSTHSDDLEARVARLETQLDRITMLLERMAQQAPRASNMGAPGAPGSGGPARVRTFEAAPMTTAGPAAPAPRVERLEQQERMERERQVSVERRVAEQSDLFTVEGHAQQIMIRSYRLPKGKRAAMLELMQRDDVPIAVRGIEGGIEVHASPEQHHVFEMFLKVINPDGDREREREASRRDPRAPATDFHRAIEENEVAMAQNQKRLAEIERAIAEGRIQGADREALERARAELEAHRAALENARRQIKERLGDGHVR